MQYTNSLSVSYHFSLIKFWWEIPKPETKYNRAIFGMARTLILYGITYKKSKKINCEEKDISTVYKLE